MRQARSLAQRLGSALNIARVCSARSLGYDLSGRGKWLRDKDI